MPGSESRSTPSDVAMHVTQGAASRLPIYLLLDCSYSMLGSPLEALKQGLETFAAETKRDMLASETVHVGVIVFQGDDAHLLPDTLVPIGDFDPGVLNLTAQGATPLGAALRELARSIDRDVKPTVSGKPKGDWKPLAFILTDGRPTDDWHGPRQEIINRTRKKLLNVVSVGCGPEVDRDTLKDISTMGATFVLDEVTERVFIPFFKWISQTAIRASHEVSDPEAMPGSTTVNPPAPPKHMQPFTF